VTHTRTAEESQVAAPDYEVLVGINYGPDQTRAEPGAVVSDLPAKSLGWLVEQQIVRLADPATPAPATPPLPADPKATA
jgi:hypothetical protein